jgi:hypothetical protein
VPDRPPSFSAKFHRQRGSGILLHSLDDDVELVCDVEVISVKWSCVVSKKELYNRTDNNVTHRRIAAFHQ